MLIDRVFSRLEDDDPGDRSKARLFALLVVLQLAALPELIAGPDQYGRNESNVPGSARRSLIVTHCGRHSLIRRARQR